MEDCKRIFEKHSPTYVLHLAAKVGGLFNNLKYKVCIQTCALCCAIHAIAVLTGNSLHSQSLHRMHISISIAALRNTTRCTDSL
jgi:hypothetical protein